jgi:transcriptional regulator with PAS, ATPase and Fis domain
MTIVLHYKEFPAAPTDRLQRLGLVCRSFCASEVQDLAHGLEELVYLIPFAVMRTPVWPKLRVRFAQANRFYLAYVEQPVTAEIVECLRDGASDVLSLLDDDQRWASAIVHTVRSQQHWLQLYGGCPLNAEDTLIGKSPAMVRMRQTIEKLGATDVCVLITGESGVGKERVANALHKAGNKGPFVAVNCAAIPHELLESELFGVEKGAFTGAAKTRQGLVEQANEGTLFLDEIGEMEPSIQPKLLRFLETRQARRVGGEKEYRVKVRVISATNRNLDTAIAEQRFRSDLYYRLAEIILQIPPLRSRPEDIPELALTFLKLANERFGKNFEMIDPDLIERFQRYSWNGNVRELKSAIDRMALLFDGPVLRAPWWEAPEDKVSDNIPETKTENIATMQKSEFSLPSYPVAGSAQLSRKQKMDLARRLLQESDDNYSWVAGQLGINSVTLWRWRKAGKL